jgi:hypothetical protein
MHMLEVSSLMLTQKLVTLSELNFAVIVRKFVSKNRIYSLKIDRNTVFLTVVSADQFKISLNHKTRNS